MKIFLKLLMALVVLAVAAPFFLKDKNGAPLMALNDLKMPDLSTPPIPDNIKSAVSGITSNSETFSSAATDSSPAGGKVKVHKWKDEEGVWHFSSVDSSQRGTSSQVIFIDPTQNNFTPPPSREQPEQVEEKVATTAAAENVTPNILLPLTHGKSTLEQAKQVQKLLEQRADLQRRMAP